MYVYPRLIFSDTFGKFLEWQLENHFLVQNPNEGHITRQTKKNSLRFHNFFYGILKSREDR